MTANRWWVKGYARWIARVRSVQGQLNLLFTAMSGVGIASGALKYLGAPTWVIAILLGILALGIIAYIWLYSEGGVWNQMRRDQSEMSANFADPKARINAEMTARPILAGIKGRELTPAERQAISAESVATFAEYRDGAEIPDDSARVQDGETWAATPESGDPDV